jgi:acyl-CoA thioesterase FadM
MEQLGDTAERACTKVFETVESQTLPPTPPTVVLHVVRPYEIDINNHVNTACYFEWLQSAWSDMSGQMPNKLSAYRLEFLRSAQWRDAVTIETQAAGPNVWRQAIKNTNGEILVTNVCVSNCP